MFDAPQLYLPLSRPFLTAAALARAGAPVANDGTFPFQRYVVLGDGDVRIGALACGTCHTRVMPDGEVVKGGQGNYPANRLVANAVLAIGGQPPLAGIANSSVRPGSTIRRRR